VPRLEPRIVAITVVMIAVLCAVAVRLYYLQVLHHSELSELADRNRIRIVRLSAPRGLVFDRNHVPLVDTKPSFDAVVVPEDTDDLSDTAAKLEKYLGQDHIASKVENAEDEDRPAYQPVTVAERLSWPQVVALETHQLELPGVSLSITPGRHYLYGSLAAHLLGYVGEVTESDLRKNAGYRMGDEIGKFGLERGWENFLRGDAGGEEVEVDSVGRRMRVLKEIADKPGQSVVLTIDLQLQQAAEAAMEGKNGSLVAVDPNTGEILAMVSHPTFDPNVFGAGVREADWKSLTTDPNHPLENRAIQGIYPPGSTFKIVEAVAGLEEGTLHADTAYNCPGGLWFGGREYHCWRKQGHGTIELHDAIVRSCDVYFYDVGQRLGVDRIAKWANAMGLGLKSGIALHGESAGVIPSSEWKQKRFHERWYPAETLSVAIGQGYVAVTPLQMAQVAAMIASGGFRYKPHFVRYVEGLDGGIAKAYQPKIEGQFKLSPDDLDTIRNAMCDVVNSPWGTAHMARLDNVTVCGKTGTAQMVGDKEGEAGEKEEDIPLKYRDHAWFIAFAPKEHPQIALSCIVEHGGHGGSAAAPVIHDVLKRFFELHPPQTQTPEIARVIDRDEEPAQ